MNCLNCKKLISDKAKYCSDRCRMAFKRSNKEPEQIQPEQQKEPEQKKVNVRVGYCHSCNKEVSKLCCICLDCISKGITHKKLGLEICEQV